MTNHLLAVAITIALPFSAYAESATQAPIAPVEANCGSDSACLTVALASLSSGFQPLKLGKLVSFEWGKVHVHSDGRDDLKAVAKAWRESSLTTVITVEGYAVADDEEASIALGQKRADQVRNYLIRFGVDPQCAVAIGNARVGLADGGGRYVDLTLEAKRPN